MLPFLTLDTQGPLSLYLLLSKASSYQLRTLALRYFNVYGNGENQKGDYASVVTLFLKARKNGESLVIYGNGTQARDLIDVRDVAQITLDLLEKGSYHIYNVGTGVATTYATIAGMIDEHHITYVPNPLPSYQDYTRAETTRLREALGDYQFIELERGIEDMKLEFYSNRNPGVSG